MPTYYNEHEPFAAAWLRGLIEAEEISGGHVDQRDIQTVQPADVRGYERAHFFAGIAGWDLALRLAGWPADRPVWTGSCPCQPFSSAGKGGGFDDSRHLWPTWFRLIRECRPPVVFGEQVASPAGRAWFDHVATDLECEGYAIGAADLPAASIGAPHIRSRLWWVANADHKGWQGAKRTRKQDSPRQWSAAACGESVRSDRRPWPPGPGEVNAIPLLANGLPGVVGACKAYGNAIVPQVAAAFVRAFMETAR